MIDDMAMVWLHLRERRANFHAKSKLNESQSRRKTFAAAIQQFEEQFTAAKQVTPTTSPLNLYYGLTQAGMGIVAAYAPEPWTFNSHGLELKDTTPVLADIYVRPKQIKKARGGFQTVAAATGSTSISKPVSIGMLWESLPDLSEYAPLPGTPCLSALRVVPDPGLPGYSSGGGLPTRRWYGGPLGAYVHVKRQAQDRPRGWFHELMKHYPTAKGWIPKESERWSGYPAQPDTESVVRIELISAGTDRALSDEELDPIYDSLAPEYRYRGDRYMRPSFEGEDELPPSPLMTWWLLLYSFSMLARYQPRKWVDLLDLDRSRSAVQIQYALQTALSAIPHLILDALDGKPSLLRKPTSPWQIL